MAIVTHRTPPHRGSAISPAVGAATRWSAAGVGDTELGGVVAADDGAGWMDPEEADGGAAAGQERRRAGQLAHQELGHHADARRVA